MCLFLILLIFCFYKQKSHTEVQDFCLHLVCQRDLAKVTKFDTNAPPLCIGGDALYEGVHTSKHLSSGLGRSMLVPIMIVALQFDVIIHQNRLFLPNAIHYDKCQRLYVLEE